MGGIAAKWVTAETGTYFILNGPEYVVCTRIFNLTTDAVTDGIKVYYVYLHREAPRRLGWSPSGTLRLSRGMS